MVSHSLSTGTLYTPKHRPTLILPATTPMTPLSLSSLPLSSFGLNSYRTAWWALTHRITSHCTILQLLMDLKTGHIVAMGLVFFFFALRKCNVLIRSL